MKIYEPRISGHDLFFVKILCLLALFGAAAAAARAQSTNQNFPTPITTNEIGGAIRARDLGDARLTTYFYTFNGNQGDIFINVVTKNLDGDIDVFTAEGLRPLTKVRVYSDNSESETGRVIYLRQPQKLILRIEGRTPTDEPASFRIKFAGSFEAVTGVAATEDQKDPEVRSNEQGDIRVNSVGTIIEVRPKPTPTPKPATARVERREPEKNDESPETVTAKKDEPAEPRKKREVVVTENSPAKKDEPEAETDEKNAGKTDEKTDEKTSETTADNNRPRRSPRPRRPNPRTGRNQPAVKPEPKPESTRKSEVVPVEPSQLENIRLVVEFKDGRKIERPMSEVLKFGVDKGILTIIAKDGSIGRYSILDIAKMTVE